jgi:hypothetical protein
MENNKITSVAWLIKQIKEDQTIKAKSMGEWNTVFHKSKAMEKEQMIEAIDYCRERYIDSENYYNQKYGK